jgi:hypothetical protein
MILKDWTTTYLMGTPKCKKNNITHYRGFLLGARLVLYFK